MTTQMVNVSIPTPDTTPLREAELALAWAAKLSIASTDDYALAAVEIKSVKRQHKELDALRKSIVKPLDEARARIQTLFKPALNYLDKAETIIEGKMLAYQTEQRWAAEEAARTEAERLRTEQEALATMAEQCGDPETAEDLRGQHVHVPVAAPVAAEGTRPVTRWTAELTDIIALCKAVADGAAPAELVQLNQPAANRLATALRDAVSYPGLRFVSTTSLAVRT
jgi:hypothetical protein